MGRPEGGKGTHGEKGRLPGVVALQDEAEKRAAGLSGRIRSCRDVGEVVENLGNWVGVLA